MLKVLMKINDALTLIACSAVAFYAGMHMGLFDGDTLTVAAAAGAVFASATAHA